MDPVIVPLAIAAYGLLFAPQAPAAHVVLLPQADGRPSAVVVRGATGETTLQQAYAAVDVGRGGTLTPRASDAAAVRARFGEALAAQPPRPVSYTVNFVFGKNELTAESRAALDAVKAEIARRPAPEIAVIGHTDRVGSEAANDALSLARAGLVRDELVAAGVPAGQVEAVGRGEREPLVPTADEVAEPRNRRVEINIR